VRCDPTGQRCGGPGIGAEEDLGLVDAVDKAVGGQPDQIAFDGSPVIGFYDGVELTDVVGLAEKRREAFRFIEHLSTASGPADLLLTNVGRGVKPVNNVADR